MKNPAHHLMVLLGAVMWIATGQVEPGAYILALGVIGMLWSLFTG